jgi:hypothetical protein
VQIWIQGNKAQNNAQLRKCRGAAQLGVGTLTSLNWVANIFATIPWLHVKGEFIGGCDIVREMYVTGELREVFSSRGIKTQAA